MKKIEAIIKPWKLGQVREELGKIGILKIASGEIQFSNSSVEDGDSMPMVEIKMVVADDRVSGVIDCIKSHAETGKNDGGEIQVTSVEQIIPIRKPQTIETVPGGETAFHD